MNRTLDFTTRVKYSLSSDEILLWTQTRLLWIQNVVVRITLTHKSRLGLSENASKLGYRTGNAQRRLLEWRIPFPGILNCRLGTNSSPRTSYNVSPFLALLPKLRD